MAKRPWRSRLMPPIFNISCENHKMHIWCKFGDFSSNPLKVIGQTRLNSYNSKSKWPKWHWRSKSMTSIFNTSWEHPRMHVWCKFGDSYPNLWRVIMLTSQNGQNDLEGQGQWPPFSTSESIPRCMFGANLVILTEIYDDLLHRQAEFLRILSQNGPNDLEGQDQWLLFSIPTESILWCMFGANLVIPSQICDELSRGQGKVYGQTDGQTDGQTQATTIPFGLKGKGVKIYENIV